MSDLGVRTDSGVRELARFWPVVLVCGLVVLVGIVWWALGAQPAP